MDVDLVILEMETWFFLLDKQLFKIHYLNIVLGVSLDDCTYISSATVSIFLNGEVRIVKKKKKDNLLSWQNWWVPKIKSWEFLNPSFFIYICIEEKWHHWHVCQNFKIDLLYESCWQIIFSVTAVNIVPCTEWKGIWMLKKNCWLATTVLHLCHY